MGWDPNKVLWLDHGKQFCFSDDVGTTCDAYEEFLITKRVPDNQEAIKQMAKEYQERLERERAKKEMTEQQRLLDVLNKSNRAAAENAAREFLGITE